MRGNISRILDVIVVLGLITPACVIRRSGPEGAGSDKVTVLVIPALSSAPLLIAADGGYLAAQGIDAELVKIDQSATALPALTQGKLDVWGGTISLGILNGIARGARIRIVAGKGYIPAAGCVYSGLIARRALVDSGRLTTPDTMRGLRIAAQPVNFERFYLEKLLDAGRLRTADVVLTNVPHAAEIGALETGQVDLVATTEPWLGHAVQAGCGTVWMSAGAIIPEFQFGWLAFGPTLLDTRPDLGRRFMAAYLAAVRQYNEGKTDRNLDILTRQTGLERDFLKHACWPAFRADGGIDAQSILEFQSWGLRRGFLDRTLAVEDIVDSRFVDYAVGLEKASKH